MTDFAFFVIVALMGLAFLCLIFCLIFAGMWTYRDARARGLDAGVWLLVVLLVPNFLGLLIYALTARREYRYPCESCGHGVAANSSYCPNCGAPLDPERVPPVKRGSKGLLAGFFVSLALTFLLMLGAIGGVVFTELLPGGFESIDWSPSISTIYIENNWGDNWNVSWHYTNKSPTHSLYLTEDGPSVLYFTGSCNEGPLTLTVRQGEVERTFDLSGEERSDSLDLSIFSPGKVQLILDNEKGEGKGVKFTSHWE